MDYYEFILLACMVCGFLPISTQPMLVMNGFDL